VICILIVFAGVETMSSVGCISDISERLSSIFTQGNPTKSPAGTVPKVQDHRSMGNIQIDSWSQWRVGQKYRHQTGDIMLDLGGCGGGGQENE
jgi:hypothetical protein